MRAAVVEHPNQLVIKDIPKPTIKPNEVLIRVECASICNATDNHILEGTFDGYHDFYPQVLGHEVCGVICEVGADVTNLQLGQRIALYTPNGAFQEYVPVASDAIIAHVPDNVPSDVAAICEMFHGTYVGMLGPAMLKGTERVLIIGAGPMGLTATALASLMAKTVCVVDYFPNRLEKAVEMGADFVYDHSKMSADEIIEALKRDIGEIDLSCMCMALDKSPQLDAFYLAQEITRPNGRMTGLNVEMKLSHHNHHMNPFHLNRKNIRYQHFLERPEDYDDFQRGYDLVAQGKLPMEKLITHHITLDQLPWALDMTHNHLDQCIKIVVDIAPKE